MTSWTGRRTVVTGAGGFIGSHLVQRLVELGGDVTAFVRYNSRNQAGQLEAIDARRDIRVEPGDITELDTVRALIRGADTVFHLAALVGIPYSYVHPPEVVAANIGGTLNVLTAAREAEVRRVVVTSTSEVFGSALYTPMDENHPRQPQSPYAATKIGADALAFSFHRSFELPVAILRPFNTYGPRQSERAVIPTVVSQALAGADEIVLGNLEPRRDLTFVTDTVEGFVRIAESEAAVGQDVNVGSGASISVGGLVERILALTGKDIPVRQDQLRVRPAASEVLDLVADAAKAHELMGWAPSVSLDEGLKRTIEWARQNPGNFEPGIYRI